MCPSRQKKIDKPQLQYVIWSFQVISPQCLYETNYKIFTGGPECHNSIPPYTLGTQLIQQSINSIIKPEIKDV